MNESTWWRAGEGLAKREGHLLLRRATRTSLVSSISWSLAGTCIFFVLYGCLGRQGVGPAWTLMSAFLAGATGVYFSTLWLRRFPKYRAVQFAILCAYGLRVLIGVLVYLAVVNPSYFSGSGAYTQGYRNYEYYLTYGEAMSFAYALTGDKRLQPEFCIPLSQDKNADIHRYMGAFMAAGDSPNALDLAPFNAFHNVVAGVLVIGLSMAVGYPLRVGLLSGAITAWMPWAFASSLMWRDCVGLTWVVLSVALLLLGSQYGLYGILWSTIPASFLAWSDRTPYIFAIIGIAILLAYDRQKADKSNLAKMMGLVAAVGLASVLLYNFWHVILFKALAFHKIPLNLRFWAFKVLVAPLLVLKALVGPFPWLASPNFNLYVIFDYAFYVFQLAAMMILVINWRFLLRRINLLLYAASIFFIAGFISGRVHTAYLAVAAPFWIPIMVNIDPRLTKLCKYLLSSVLIFILLNSLYILFGIQGSHWLLNITGH